MNLRSENVPMKNFQIDAEPFAQLPVIALPPARKVLAFQRSGGLALVRAWAMVVGFK